MKKNKTKRVTKFITARTPTVPTIQKSNQVVNNIAEEKKRVLRRLQKKSRSNNYNT